MDELPQPITQQQKSYPEDTTGLINFIERTKVLPDTILVSLDVQPYHRRKELGQYAEHTAIPLVLQVNLFRGNNFLQTHGTAMGTKIAAAFANILLAHIEEGIIRQSKTKRRKWKHRY